MPILTKTGLKLGDGNYVLHNGKVVKLSVQCVSPGITHWIAVVDDTAHIVTDVFPSEHLEDGVTFEDLVWEVLSLLLQHAGIAQADVSQLDGLCSKFSSQLKDYGERIGIVEGNSRRALLEVEDLTKEHRISMLRMDALHSATKVEILSVRKEFEEEMAELRASLASVNAKFTESKKENAQLREDNDELRALVMQMKSTAATIGPATMMTTRSMMLEKRLRAEMDLIPMATAKEAEAQLLRAGAKKGRHGKWDTTAALHDVSVGVVKWLHSEGLVDPDATLRDGSTLVSCSV